MLLLPDCEFCEVNHPDNIPCEDDHTYIYLKKKKTQKVAEALLKSISFDKSFYIKSMKRFMKMSFVAKFYTHAGICVISKRYCGTGVTEQFWTGQASDIQDGIIMKQAFVIENRELIYNTTYVCKALCISPTELYKYIKNYPEHLIDTGNIVKYMASKRRHYFLYTDKAISILKMLLIFENNMKDRELVKSRIVEYLDLQ